MSETSTSGTSDGPFEPRPSPRQSSTDEAAEMTQLAPEDFRHLQSSSEDSDENEAVGLTGGLPENDMGVTARDEQADANLLEQILDTRFVHCFFFCLFKCPRLSLTTTLVHSLSLKSGI